MGDKDGAVQSRRPDEQRGVESELARWAQEAHRRAVKYLPHCQDNTMDVGDVVELDRCPGRTLNIAVIVKKRENRKGPEKSQTSRLGRDRRQATQWG